MSNTESEYRFDPLQQRWVIIASERGKRPSDFQPQIDPTQGKFNPFAPGNEDKTPPEILSVPSENGDPWKIRVVPNKFPALRVEGQPNREPDGIYDSIEGVGAHEVIIETPDETSTIADRSIDDITDLLKVYRTRIQDLSRDSRLRYILVFKNHGSFAGASLKHPHSQIMATTVTPRIIQTELNASHDHYLRKERCLICDIIQQEIHDRERLITIDDRFIAFCPYASRFPFEVFIAPRHHSHDYTQSDDTELRALAGIMKDVFSRLKVSLNDPPYNFVLHTAPNLEGIPKGKENWPNLPLDFHWHLELLPRLTNVAGFEWGTGIYINPTPPEAAAKYLHEAESSL